jgi:hypothetical protein
MCRIKLPFGLFLVLVAISLMGCSGLKEWSPYVEYTPPLLPMKFVITPAGIEVNVGPRIATLIGTFEVGAALPLTPGNDTDLILVLRHLDKGEDVVYEIKDGTAYVIIVDGKTQIEVSGNTIVVDVTEANTVEARPRENPETAAGPGSRARSTEGYNCPGSFPSRLVLGDSAKIAIFQVQVYERPSTQSPLVRYKYLAKGREIMIIDGPICAERQRWWMVDSGEIRLSDGSLGTVVGWVPEESGDQWMLEPNR